MWPWKRRPQAPPKPDYNYIRRLEVELGIVLPPVVTNGTMTQEEWFEICRRYPDA